MRIYFIRHGETLWNREKKIQGTTPYTDLTDFGVRLAEMTREGLAKRSIRFDRAYTSPLRRAVHTAEIILEGQPCPLVEDSRLREMGFGCYEGTKIGEGLWADDNIRAMFNDPVNYRPPQDADTFEAVAERLKDFLDSEIKPLEGSCENVLAISHGGAMRTLLRLMLDIPLAAYWKGRQPNCCAHIISLEHGCFTLLEQSVVFYDTALAASVPSV